jgi:hypothetical protein
MSVTTTCRRLRALVQPDFSSKTEFTKNYNKPITKILFQQKFTYQSITTQSSDLHDVRHQGKKKALLFAYVHPESSSAPAAFVMHHKKITTDQVNMIMHTKTNESKIANHHSHHSHQRRCISFLLVIFA